MRVGIDIRELEQGRATGIGRYLRSFIVHACRQRPEHRFFLYGNQRTQPGQVAENASVRLVEERMTLWWDQVILPALARKDQVDVFLSPYVKGPVAVRCPLVITIHDLLDLLYPEYRGWHQRPRIALLRQMIRWTGRRAAVVQTDSEHSRQDVQAQLGLPPEKVEVLPLGVDECFAPVRDADRLQRVWARYGIEPPYVLYLGNFKPHKNVQALLRAFAALPPGLGTRHQLVLAGRPDAWQGQRRQLAADLGLGDRARFVGHVADEDAPSLYSGAELFVFPSLYEGFGLPPLEAMACGTAVVAADRTSLPEVVGDAGMLVDPEDVAGLAGVISSILGNQDQRRELQEKGLAQAHRFRAAEMYEQQIRLLERVAAGRRSGGSREGVPQ